jgi:hypothetical protein
MAVLQIIGLVLFKFYGWVVVVAILGYLVWQNNRRRDWVTATDNILLLIEVPKDNEKKELSAEQMFASLHGILRPRSELQKEGSLQEHVCLVRSRPVGRHHGRTRQTRANGGGGMDSNPCPPAR